MNISSVNNFNLDTVNAVENEAASRGQSNADEIKNLQRARLNREVMRDPSLVGKIVALESTMVYNSSAQIVQAVSPSSLTD